MPLNKKGKKIKTSMTKRYGKKKGEAVSYTHLRAHETGRNLVFRGMV